MKKIERLRKLLNEIQKLESDTLKAFPPKKILLIWERDYYAETVIYKHYSLEEARLQIKHIIGYSNPKDYKFYICSIIEE